MCEKARHELKHSINYGDYIVLKNRLNAVMQRDCHAGAEGEYQIRSLYFDTPNDNALREKLDGVNRREKFRIRYYNFDENYIMLEKKSKINGLCYKHSERLTREEAEDLIKGKRLAANKPLSAELIAKMQTTLLKPKTIVDYLRTPFIYSAGNVRITFDRQIKTGLLSTDFFSLDTPMISVRDDLIILEVKYDEFIPDFIVQLLQIGNRRANACSKYALCRTYC